MSDDRAAAAEDMLNILADLESLSDKVAENGEDLGMNFEKIISHIKDATSALERHEDELIEMSEETDEDQDDD
jgi:ABC-type transporter Mla subunit MlaD